MASFKTSCSSKKSVLDTSMGFNSRVLESFQQNSKAFGARWFRTLIQYKIKALFENDE
jgi:hypothetical protein